MKIFAYTLLVACCCLEAVNENKLLICGVCKNVAFAVPNTIENIEKLGSRFSDYAVIIYENNSSDKTPQLFYRWSKNNPRVKFISEQIPGNLLKAREENIANARNRVLSTAREPIYQNFKYLLMVDLDFKTPWPIDEIVNTIELPFDWDCISANGIINRNNCIYWDRYAFRDASHPFGPELLGNEWWREQNFFPLVFPQTRNFIPVYSAFGGLAIYKTETITKFSYSGTVTSDLTNRYRLISSTRIGQDQMTSSIPINYRENGCCEHVTLHAAMANKGFDKFYINTAMVMVYNLQRKEFRRVKLP